MKKRRFWMIIMLIACLWISRINTISAKADNIMGSSEIDEVLIQFMIAHGPNASVSIDCETSLFYTQMSDGNKVSGTSEGGVREYGFDAAVYAEGGISYVHMYLDIRFDAKATVTDEDVIRITSPDGMNVPTGEVLASQLLTRDESSESWSYTDSDVQIVFDEKDILLSGRDINHTKGERRVLLYIGSKSSINYTASPLNVSITWENEHDQSQFPWKAILIVLLIDLDIVAVIIIVRHILKKRRIKQESPEQQAAIADEAEAELQQNLKLKPEDVEYLKEIGYFDPNKK